MENATMGRVVVSAKMENIADCVEVMRGTKKPEEIRTLVVDDALVDTGATTVSMPKRFITQLGLLPLRSRPARTAAGSRMVQIYGGVRLTVQERECNCDVQEVADDCPVLIGQVPLELLDFVVDPKGQQLIGNPLHGGQQMIEQY
jgi:predicted aspartyl protease